MRIRALAQLRGPSISVNPGDEIEVPDDIGRALVGAKAAIEVVVAAAPARTAIEEATESAPETAMEERTARRRGGRAAAEE